MTRKNIMDTGEIHLYKEKSGQTAVEVHFFGETVWLTLNQIAGLFDRDKSVISRHLGSIYKSGELVRRATVAKNATVQVEGGRKVKRVVEYYNLDAILSVGYRVNSKRGTQFRIWASRVIKDHLIKGYSLNQKRLQERQALGFKELESAIELVRSLSGGKALTGDEGKGLLDVITRYAKSWLLLQQYDEDRLLVPGKSDVVPATLEYAEADAAIAALKKDLKAKGAASDLFGRERGDSLAGILGSLEQTFGGQALYPSVEAKAAHLLYFIIKDHPFLDGNKRIGSLLFILFLAKNHSLYRANSEAKINDNALVALALLIAESDPGHKDILVKLVINLLWEAAK